MTPDPSDAFTADRRGLMKAIGAGTTVAALGGAAAGRERAAAERSRRQDQPDAGASVHDVRTLIAGPPTNPERPADFFYQPTGIHVQPGDVLRFRFETPDHNVVSYHPAFGMRRRVPTGVAAFSSPLLGWRPDSIPGDQVDPPAAMEGPPAGEDGTATATGTPADEATETPAEETAEDAGEAGGPVADSWLLALETPGVYDLLCSPHETFGMAMRVVVGDVTEAPFETDDPEALPEPRVGPVGLARTTLTDPALAPSAVVDAGTVAWTDLEAVSAGAAGTETPTESG